MYRISFKGGSLKQNRYISFKGGGGHSNKIDILISFKGGRGGHSNKIDIYHSRGEGVTQTK